jgi:hypothetical protein
MRTIIPQASGQIETAAPSGMLGARCDRSIVKLMIPELGQESYRTAGPRWRACGKTQLLLRAARLYLVVMVQRSPKHPARGWLRTRKCAGFSTAGACFPLIQPGFQQFTEL